MKPVLAALLAISLTFAAADSTKTKPVAKPASSPAKTTTTATKSTAEKSSTSKVTSTATKATAAAKPATDKAGTTKSSTSTAKSTTEKSSSVKSTTVAKPVSAKSETPAGKPTTEKSDSKEKTANSKEKSSVKSDSSSSKKSTMKVDSTKSLTADSLEEKEDSLEAEPAPTARSVDTLVLIDSSSYFDSASQAATAKANSLDSAAVVKESKDRSTVVQFLKVGVVTVLALIIAGLFGFTMMRMVREKKTVIRKKDGHKNFLTRTRISVMDSEVQLVCKYVEGHYYDPELTSESACRALITGQSFVETLFRRELDMTLDQFITHVRIHHAIGSINDGFRGTAEKLGEKCGYVDMTRFADDFRTVTGNQLSTMLAARSDV